MPNPTSNHLRDGDVVTLPAGTTTLDVVALVNDAGLALDEVVVEKQPGGTVTVERDGDA